MTTPTAQIETPSRMMSVLRARCIARYRLRSIPGRPEELESPTTKQRISFGYIHGSVRIRQHGGPTNREWIDHRDITFKEGWLSEAYDYLDPFFGYIPERDIKAPRMIDGQREFDITPILDERPIVAPRPIRDNPQA